MLDPACNITQSYQDHHKYIENLLDADRMIALR
jgi:hypothetical protein